jgi:hypothetical protein
MIPLMSQGRHAFSMERGAVSEAPWRVPPS